MKSVKFITEEKIDDEKQKNLNSLVNQINKLGYEVKLTEKNKK